MLYRQIGEGSLGLINVKYRAMALLIRFFLETAANPIFNHNLFHEVGNTRLQDPGFTTYYDKHFFETIKHFNVKHQNINIAVLSTKQWYWMLMDEYILKEEKGVNLEPNLIPIRCEKLNLEEEWSITWRMCRLKGLGS